MDVNKEVQVKWQPKHGERVLVKNHGNEYREREFIGVTSEGKYLCWYEDKTNALPFVHIKPIK